MRKVINLKFDQNDGLRDKLLATIGHLYEATKGDSFSCGFSLAQAKDRNPLLRPTTSLRDGSPENNLKMAHRKFQFNNINSD